MVPTVQANNTPMTKAVFEERGAVIQATTPFGRFGRPEVVASVVTFLSGPSASYITGQTINVDGGVWHL